jgi:hypothetical protein
MSAVRNSMICTNAITLSPIVQRRLGAGGARQLRLRSALTPGVTIVTADMTSTVFCDCSGIRSLLLAHDHAAARDAQLRLAVPAGHLFQIGARLLRRQVALAGGAELRTFAVERVTESNPHYQLGNPADRDR